MADRIEREQGIGHAIVGAPAMALLLLLAATAILVLRPDVLSAWLL